LRVIHMRFAKFPKLRQRNTLSEKGGCFECVSKFVRLARERVLDILKVGRAYPFGVADTDTS
jgi:hypothetical protein